MIHGGRALVASMILCLGVACAPGPATCPPCTTAAPQQPTDDAADVLALRNIEVVFHDAGSRKDLALMMLQHYFADIAAPFRPENEFIAYTPAQRIRTTIRGDTATLYFECLWLDTKGQRAPLHTFSDDTLVRIRGKWLIKTMKAGPVSTL
jgi:hypothetical protein